MSNKSKPLLLGLALMAAFATAEAQSFGAPGNSDEPIEIAAEQLVIDDEASTAELIGEVIIAQGEMRLAAPRVFVVYTEDRQDIQRMEARGGVLLVSSEDAAEAREADYDVAGNAITLRGDVVMTRADGSTIAGDTMRIDLQTGRAVAEGRVRTLLVPGSQ